MNFVYVAESGSSGKIYIGQTNDPDLRIAQHNNQNINKGSYTKLQGKNWKIVYLEEFGTRQEALKREKYLKSHIGRDWLRMNILGR